MHRKRKLLTVTRETIRQLTSPVLVQAQGGIMLPTGGCPTNACPTLTCRAPCATYQHSCFDSCYDTQCCLEIP
jgi:hypothetical protein